MKNKLNAKETAAIAIMLFGMFFGAGNLIFPVYMGQAAGYNIWYAIPGFLITGVGIPMLAVAALGISKSNGLLELSSKISRGYGLFFTCLLYLTIGPFFAIPRCATVPFSSSVEPLIGKTGSAAALAIFSALFFLAVLWFSLKPSDILRNIGKILTPIFLVSLFLLVIASFVSPTGKISDIKPDTVYNSHAFFEGFIQGYNTMDALAGLAFGIVVVNVIKELGITDGDAIAKNTVYAGVFSCLFMAIIYIAVTIMGVQSRGAYPLSANGSEALSVIAKHYFGYAGYIILAVTVTFACLKTSVGLITSCSEAFCSMFPKGPKYKTWAIIFCAVSFLIANIGLTSIISFSLPVLMFLYPLAITLIAVSLLAKLFGSSLKDVYVCTTFLTLIAALFDFANALPDGVKSTLGLNVLVDFAGKYLPMFSLGLGWVCPALAGIAAGVVISLVRRKTK